MRGAPPPAVLGAVGIVMAAARCGALPCAAKCDKTTAPQCPASCPCAPTKDMDFTCSGPGPTPKPTACSLDSAVGMWYDQDVPGHPSVGIIDVTKAGPSKDVANWRKAQPSGGMWKNVPFTMAGKTISLQRPGPHGLIQGFFVDGYSCGRIEWRDEYNSIWCSTSAKSCPFPTPPPPPPPTPLPTPRPTIPLTPSPTPAPTSPPATPPPTPSPTPAPTSPPATPPPATPVPTPAPPLASAPCIRFGHAMAVAEKVDVSIVQTTPANGHNHTWANYGYTEFSEWTSAFAVGEGKIIVSSGGKTVMEVEDIPLTPGPIVFVLKCWVGKPCIWPPAGTLLGENVEAIAASFVPVTAGARGRLFNLSPDTDSAALGAGGAALVSGVRSDLGSDWVSVPTAGSTYAATDEATKSIVASVEYTPDVAPAGLGVFTMWLLGEQAQQGQFAPRLLPIPDAPEGERCEPK